MFKAATIVAAVFTFALVANAEPRLGQCSGILKKDKAGIFLDPPLDVGVCNINKFQLKKVSAKCRIGGYCRISGMVDDCEDRGCTNITNITAARPGH